MIKNISKDISIVCEAWNRGSNAWGHEAKLYYNGQQIESARVRYYNRTWEAYQFDTVCDNLLSKLDNTKTLSLAERYLIAKTLQHHD